MADNLDRDPVAETKQPIDMLAAPETARELADSILAQVTAGEEIEVVLTGVEHALTRFANNEIHQNVSESDHAVAVRVVRDGRVGSATGNAFDAESCVTLLARARAAAAVMPARPSWAGMATPAEAPVWAAMPEATLALDPEQRAGHAAALIAPAARAGMTASGFVSRTTQTLAVANSRGVFQYHGGAHAALSLTVTGADSSGWGEQTVRDAALLDPHGTGERVLRKALDSAAPREVPAGEYDVILEPNAVAEMVAFLAPLGFSALAYGEGRSFLSGHLGERVTGERISIADDAAHPLTLGLPFDFEGVPRQRVQLIDRGIGCGVVHETQTAAAAGVANTGHALQQPNAMGPMPANMVVAPGEDTLEEMIARTERGILVTRFWYNRVVDPLQTIITGMTRDGTFWVENGKVVGGVRNLRFNMGVLDMLARADMIGREAVLSAGVVAPAMRVRGFRFTGVTRF